MSDHRFVQSMDELLLHDVRLNGADFSKRNLRRLSIANGSVLTGCDFRQIKAAGGGLGGGRRPTEYIECVFDGSRLKDVVPGRATFIRCSFRDVVLVNMIALKAQFIDCVFSGALKKVTFNAGLSGGDLELERTYNEYRGNDFSGAMLVDVAFRGGIDLDQQDLPVDADHLIIRDAAAVISASREDVRNWSDGRARKEAEGAFWVLESEIRSGQRDLFIDKSWLSRSTMIADNIRALLEKHAKK